MVSKRNKINGDIVLDTNRNRSTALISIIGPCYDERENIQPFIESIESIMDHEEYNYEILLINDGSQDDSAVLLDELRQSNPRLHVIHLARNFGQQAAMLAGIVEAKGDVLVTMDTDLQHPAEAIPGMIRQWEDGADVVYAVPDYHSEVGNRLGNLHQSGRKHSIYKTYSSRIYQAVIGWIQEPGQTYVSTDFRLFDREVAEIIRRLPERNLYLRNVFAWLCPIGTNEDRPPSLSTPNAFRSGCISYRLSPRQYGTTKYSTSQLIRLALMGLTNGGTRPMRIGVYIGLITLIFSGMIILFQLLYHGITWSGWQGWEIALMAGLLIGGVQLGILCLIGIYTGKIYQQSQDRPTYIIRNKQQKNRRFPWNGKQGHIPLPLQQD